LGRLLDEGRRVYPLYVQSHLIWQHDELEALTRLLRAVASPLLERLAVLDLPLGDVYGNHWSISGRGVPGDSSADHEVYLPGRNALLLVKAAVWCRLHDIDEVAIGVLKTSPFVDAKADFFELLEAAMDRATGGRVRIVRPFEHCDKRMVLEHRGDLPLELTFSCISPADGLHCGQCNKCAERAAAFRLVGTPDPTRYASQPRA
jgi:7-cyano-7-deazaguanine synthase